MPPKTCETSLPALSLARAQTPCSNNDAPTTAQASSRRTAPPALAPGPASGHRKLRPYASGAWAGVGESAADTVRRTSGWDNDGIAPALADAQAMFGPAT
jgi:hypothetical protein